MYRPGGQGAPGGSGPWGNDAGPSYGQPPRSPQRPGVPGGFSGPGGRTGDAGNVPTGYQRPGWDSPAGYQRPFAEDERGSSGRSMPSGYQRPPAASRDTYAAYQDWALGTPETRIDAYSDAAPSYGRSQAFRSDSTPMYQPGGQPWQQYGGAGAPTAYPGSQPGYDDGYSPYNQAPEPPRRSKKTALTLLAVLVILGAVGGGAAYLYIGSRPLIAVTSKYMVGTTPAGAATTTFQVTGSRFAAHSAVGFLIDGQPEPGQDIFQSDASGAIQGDLTITSDWPLGTHTLTAKDASGSTTFQGKAIVIVAQGEANTPGPKGAPADDSSFTIKLTVHAHDKDTGQNSTFSNTLVVTGQPDPAGGKPCSPGIDTGQPQSDKGNLEWSEVYRDVYGYMQRHLQRRPTDLY